MLAMADNYSYVGREDEARRSTAGHQRLPDTPAAEREKIEADGGCGKETNPARFDGRAYESDLWYVRAILLSSL